MPQTTLERDNYWNQYPVLIKTIEILAHRESVVRDIFMACYVPAQNWNSESQKVGSEAKIIFVS